MGQLVARSKEIPASKLYKQYEFLLMNALKLKATNAKNSNCLQHMMGYFKKVISSDEKAELLEIIQNYRNGYVPLIVPVTLVNHYVRKYDQGYLKRQHYLHPHPIELQLRNHA
jgi:uncharacterized protein YbgA (DUF1722 family)